MNYRLVIEICMSGAVCDVVCLSKYYVLVRIY